MKNKMREKEGITLIALVVTIIVLIILAGVSIRLILGQNGILAKAKYAKERSVIESLKEEAGMVVAKREIERVEGKEIKRLKEDLEEGIHGNKLVEEVQIGETIYTDICYVTREGKSITVYEDGSIEEERMEIWDGVSKSKPEIDKEKNWHIKTPSEMKYFADFVNGKLTEEEKGELTIEQSTIVYLENNLDLGARQEDGILKKGAEWEPVGGVDITNKLYFNGIFEGNGHTIKGVYVRHTDRTTLGGIFGFARVINNLTIKDSYVIGISELASIATVSIRIENCHNVNTSVISTGYDYQIPDTEEIIKLSYVGGIVAQANEIINCSNSGNVSAEGGYVGGIASMGGITANNCTNTGNISRTI